MKHVIELYDQTMIEKQKKKYKVSRAALAAFVFVALAVCIALVCATGTLNASKMSVAVIVVSGACGCAAIYFGTFVVAQTKYEYTHAENMVNGEKETYSGKLTLEKGEMRIIRSISIKRAVINDGREEKRLLVNARVAHRLPLDKDITVYVAHGYIAAYEENDENI